MRAACSTCTQGSEVGVSSWIIFKLKHDLFWNTCKPLRELCVGDCTVRLYQWVLQHTLLVSIDTRTPLVPKRNSVGTHEHTPAHLQHVASLWPRLPLLYQAVLNKVYNDWGCIFGVRGLGSAYVLRELHHAEAQC